MKTKLNMLEFAAGFSLFESFNCHTEQEIEPTLYNDTVIDLINKQSLTKTKGDSY